MAAPLTEAAIQQVRDLIATGQLVPGQRLPPEAELADLLGTSRNTVREAVRALVTARVLDVRRGDGTYVTSLRPELLLAGIGAAADLLQDGFTLELVQVRRILEPAATAIGGHATSATRRSPSSTRCLHRMSAGVAPRTSSSSSTRSSTPSWRRRRATQRWPRCSPACRAAPPAAGPGAGSSKPGATERTISEHAEILAALRARRPALAEAAALLHVSTTEAWFQQVLDTGDDRAPGWDGAATDG